MNIENSYLKKIIIIQVCNITALLYFVNANKSSLYIKSCFPPPQYDRLILWLQTLEYHNKHNMLSVPNVLWDDCAWNTKGLDHCFCLREVWKSVCRDRKRKAEYVFHLLFRLSSAQQMRTRCIRCAIESCTIFDQKLQAADFTFWQRSLWAWMIPEVDSDQS